MIGTEEYNKLDTLFETFNPMRPPSIFFEFGHVYIFPAMVCRRGEGGGGGGGCGGERVYMYIFIYMYICIYIYIYTHRCMYVWYMTYTCLCSMYVFLQVHVHSFIFCFHVCGSCLFVPIARMRSISKGYG